MIELDFGREIDFDHIVLAEYRYVQRIERFELEYIANGTWHPIQSGTVVGHKRICRFSAVRSQYIRLTIMESRWCPRLSSFEVYRGAGD